MQLNLHQTHHEIADFGGIFNYITSSFQENYAAGLHLFPELFLTGYPLQDLVLRKSFIDEYQSLLDDLSAWSISSFKPLNNKPTALLMGGLDYQFDNLGLPTQIENVIYLIEPGKKLKAIYTKQLLPNYDLYEEKKYFTTGNTPGVLQFCDKTIGLLICEDMWFSHLHETDPVLELQDHFSTHKIKCDLVINLSGSPYHLGKVESRYNRALEISQLLKAPFVYVNRVGAEDEIIFDGNSFVTDGSEIILKSGAFVPTYKSIQIPEFKNANKELIRAYRTDQNSWATLYSTRLSPDTKSLLSLSDDECEEILNAILLGINDYAIKNHLKKFTIALSGGLDSSIVLTILKILQNIRPIEIEAVFMPGFYSSSLSFDLSYDLCRNLGIKLTSFPIKFIHSAIRNAYKDHFGVEPVGLSDENIQSRLRGALIYMRSNQTGSAVLNTSNKSELSVGYSTLYGDSVGALSILGDLYKSEVFDLAKYINRKFKDPIPEDIISRPPSAELRDNQEDSQSLPPYSELDPILEALLSGRFSSGDLIKKGHSEQNVKKVNQLLTNSEYKRKQFCPIIKVKPKSFGFGHRVPISKKFL